MEKTIKSCMPVQQANEWLARVRLADGTEILKGHGAGYTLHQAQTYCDSVLRDAARHGIEAALA